MKIADKLATGVFIMIAFSLAIAAMGWYGLSDMNDKIRSMYEDRLMPVKEFLELKSNLVESRTVLITMISESSRQKRKDGQARLQTLAAQIDETLARNLISPKRSPAEIEKLNTIRETWREFRNTRDRQILPSIAQDNARTAFDLALGVQARRFSQMMQDVASLANLVEDEAYSSRWTAEAMAASLKKRVGFLFLIGILLSALLNMTIARSITGSLQELTDQAIKIAKGDLPCNEVADSGDEIGVLAKAFNKMTHELHHAQTKLVRLEKLSAVGQAARFAADITAIEGHSLNDILQRVLQNFCEALSWKQAAYWSLDEAAGVLRCAAFWTSLPEKQGIFEEISRKTTFPPGIGLPGRVWENRKPHWIQDVTIDNNFPRAKYAAANGLHGAFGFPLLLGDRFHGVLEFFSDRIEEPDENLLQAMSNVGVQLGLYIEKKQAKESAEDDLKLFRSLVNQSNDAIYTIDPATSCFLDVNEKACNHSGYSRDELLRMGVVDVDPEVPNTAVWKALAGEVKKRGSMIVEGGHKRKDGSIFPIEVNVKYAFVGKKEYLVAVVRDITERKKMEAMLIQSEKLSAVGQLAAGVAHEINNPLGIILGFAQSAAKKLKNSDALALPLKSIEREAMRCKNLVQNLLTFSRQDHAKMGECDLNEAITNTISIIEAQARIKSVEVLKELGVIAPILGDENQIQQVIVNLCNNAIDAMPTGGKITIRTRSGAKKTVSGAILEVEDNGSGIPDEIKNKIFNPFFTTKEVGKGTGLGLSLVYEIIKKHRGTIEVESKLGKGSIFTVFIPLFIRGD